MHPTMKAIFMGKDGILLISLKMPPEIGHGDDLWVMMRMFPLILLPLILLLVLSLNQTWHDYVGKGESHSLSRF